MATTKYGKISNGRFVALGDTVIIDGEVFAADCGEECVAAYLAANGFKQVVEEELPPRWGFDALHFEYVEEGDHIVKRATAVNNARGASVPETMAMLNEADIHGYSFYQKTEFFQHLVRCVSALFHK